MLTTKLKLQACLCSLLLLSSCTQSVYNSTGYIDMDANLVSNAEYAVASNWKYAKTLQAEGRHEIAKEYMLLALAAAQTIEEQNWIERELFALDLQIKSKR